MMHVLRESEGKRSWFSNVKVKERGHQLRTR